MRISDWSSDVCSSDLPVALLLLEQGCTVIVCNRHTVDLADVCRSADIIVAAAGSAQLVRGYWVKAGAVIIDVGINRIEGENGKSRIVGDVAATEIDHAAAYPPVPGGVGPLTIACPLPNTFKAAEIGREHVWTPVTNVNV